METLASSTVLNDGLDIPQISSKYFSLNRHFA
jgi:hypothetical protein